MSTSALKKRPATKSVAKRIDVVLIRKSGSKQDEQAQATNVAQMLDKLGVKIDDDYWYYCVVRRKDIAGNADFKRLIALVESNRVGTIYVEMQDRFGTDDPAEFFAMVNVLRSHRIRLHDLAEKLDLTQQDDGTLMRVFINAVKSSKERRDLSYRSMRKKVPLFLDTGSWPTGVQPFGFGKRCYDTDGKPLLWEWQPTTRTEGRLYYPDKSGRLKLAQESVSIPRKEKEKRWVTKLVLSENKEFVKSVRLIFKLFAVIGLSFRKISARLNDEGRLFYYKPFTHSLVCQILKNPAYVGDTHFGTTQSARYWTYGPTGDTVRVEESADDFVLPADKRRAELRSASEQLVKQNTHAGLIDRRTWNLAQTKFNDERHRTSFSPRNPNYYLNQVFVCGHCGKNMTGRTEVDRITKKRTVVYMCQSYVAAKSSGQKGKCPAYRITHADAEQLLLGKLQERSIEHDKLASEMARSSVDDQLSKLKKEGGQQVGRWFDLYSEGTKALVAYYKEHHHVSKRSLGAFSKQVDRFYSALPSDREQFAKRLRDVVVKVEKESIERAKAKVVELTQQHAAHTKNWSLATDSMKPVLMTEINKLDTELAEWRPMTRTVTERLNDLREAGDDVRTKREQLVAEIPKLEMREKGEAFRRVFKTVKLHWEQRFIKRSKTPTRPLKTNRPGRHQYILLKDQIEWELPEFNLSRSL